MEKPTKEKLKDFVRPLYKQLTWIEWAKYKLAGRPILDLQAGNAAVEALVRSGQAALGKIGGTEVRSLRIFLTGGPDAYSAFYAKMLRTNSGVFPVEPKAWRRFCQIYLDAIGELDFLSVWWLRYEANVIRKFAPDAKLARLRSLEPYYHDEPWSRALEGKRVLVVTPFVDTIVRQQLRLSEVWRSKPQVAPPFELKTMLIPLHESLVPSPFANWEEGLKKMKDEMARLEFDVALIGAGAWSLPLAVHAKSLGRVGIHLGGATQIFWGIKGQRWDKSSTLQPLFNDAWTRLTPEETPIEARKVEGGSYW